MTVSLVGAGPGDPGLITVRGLALLRACEVVVYDRLVAPELVAEAPPGALAIPRAGLTQQAVNELLVSFGRRGLAVVRLKGGDPFVFGRGGEEALALAEAGVPFEVVPGVSAASAVPAAAGIPLTHRGLASQATLVTAHGCDGAEPDWEALARAPGTLVLFMGLARLREAAEMLVSHGRDPATPACVISRGTLPGEEVAFASLDGLAAAAEDLASPALVVVGDVVAFAGSLACARAEPAAVHRVETPA